MPVVRFLKRFTELPNTWDGWAMRIMTISVILVFCAAWVLFGQVRTLQEQLSVGRGERNTFQNQTTTRLCTLVRHETTISEETVRALGC